MKVKYFYVDLATFLIPKPKKSGGKKVIGKCFNQVEKKTIKNCLKLNLFCKIIFCDWAAEWMSFIHLFGNNFFSIYVR